MNSRVFPTGKQTTRKAAYRPVDPGLRAAPRMSDAEVVETADGSG